MISWHLAFGPVAHLMSYWGIFSVSNVICRSSLMSHDSMIDDFMSSDLWPAIRSMPILGHISFSIEIYGSSWSCTLIPTYEIHFDTMFPPWSLSGVTQLGLHLATLRCHHAFLPRDAPLIYGSVSVVHVDDLDRAFDDGWSGLIWFFWLIMHCVW